MEMGRNRRNRVVLLDAGRAMDRAFTVRELFTAARETAPKLGLATAYRAVDRWREQGLAEDAGMRGDERLYVLCAEQDHHHHLVCVQCGRAVLLEGCALEGVRESARKMGFNLLDGALGSLPAQCDECSNTRAAAD
jgi:Fur family ferric uptake transcriptional regulator